MWVESCSGLLSTVGGGESAISTFHHPSEPDQPLKPTLETCSHQGVTTVTERIQLWRGCRCIVCWACLHGHSCWPLQPAEACPADACRVLEVTSVHTPEGATHQGCRVARMLRLTRPTNGQSCCLVGNSPRRRSAHSLNKQTNKQAPFLLPVLPVPNVPGGAVLTMFTCAIRDADCTTLTIAH